MKPIKKKTAKILTVIIAIVIAIGLIFTFIPMQFGNAKFLSFAGNVKIASDLKPGLYGEYVISGTPTSETVSKSITNLKSILGEYGYPNANVYGVGGNKVRVELAVSTAGDFDNAQSVLDAIAIGAFELRSGTDASSTFINGHMQVSDVKLGNSSGKTYVRIIFTKDAVNDYLAHMAAGGTIYVYMGDKLQTSFSAGTSATDDLYLTFEDYDSANEFRRNVLFGSLVQLTFNEDLTEINTLSATLSSAGLTADINSSDYAKSDAMVVIILSLTLCVILAICLLSVKFRAFGAITFLSLCVQTIIAMILLQAFVMIEINLAGMVTLAAGYALSLFCTIIYVTRIDHEFNEGKTLMASLEGGYKKSLSTLIVVPTLMIIVGALMLILNSGVIAVCGLILIIFAFVNALGNLLLAPWWAKILVALCGEKVGLFGLKNKGDDSNEKVKA